MSLRLPKTSQKKDFVEDRWGTIVETLAPEVFEVEFSDLEGRTYASVALPESHLMLLHHEPASAVA
jgi:hypothetical protein